MQATTKAKEFVMGKMIARRIKSNPHFDMIYYMELAGQTRVEQNLLVQLQERWNRWRDQYLSVWKLLPEFAKEDKGYLLVWLDKAVEDEVEVDWQKSPALGLASHNLAICLCMSTVQSLTPELLDGACAPLPRPDKTMRSQLKRMGLEWNPEGRVDRTYAVLTNHPYAGGCELCLMQESCMNSTTRGTAQGAEPVAEQDDLEAAAPTEPKPE
ncbi:hypothetical protein [Desulfocurvibacter africanus]|nr:hypothetical protein [Desulfocurvibacter africanus]